MRKIIALYATDDYSSKEIKQVFYGLGYRNTNGNRLSHATMANIMPVNRKPPMMADIEII